MTSTSDTRTCARAGTSAASSSTAIDRLERFSRAGLTFAVSDHGPIDGRPVIALHGFPADRHCWDLLASRLSRAGHRLLAPDQRGCSPGARPRGRREYAVSELAADALRLADAAGLDRFDVVGHDLGATVAWDLAARHAERVRSLTALSVPHHRAFADALRHGAQLKRSWYVLAFQIPYVPEFALRLVGGERTAAWLRGDGLDPATARRYAGHLVSVGGAGARINWYRGLPLERRGPLPRVSVPTLYVWGDRDRYVTRRAAEGASRYVAGPYRFEVMHGQAHWLPEACPEPLAGLLVEHFAAAGR